MNDTKQEPTLMIVGGRKRGRPRAIEPKVRMSTWGPESLCDRAIQIANEREITLSALICEALVIVVERETSKRRAQCFPPN